MEEKKVKKEKEVLNNDQLVLSAFQNNPFYDVLFHLETELDNGKMFLGIFKNKSQFPHIYNVELARGESTNKIFYQEYKKDMDEDGNIIGVKKSGPRKRFQK